jgi:hypothetical protein
MNGGPASAHPRAACTMAPHNTITALTAPAAISLRLLAQAHERNDEDEL